MKKLSAIFAFLVILGLEVYLLSCGNTPIEYDVKTEQKVGFANIFSNGHGIIYATRAEAEANSEGRIAFKIIYYSSN